MILRIGWLSPFSNRTGVGTFSKAVTDAMPDHHGGRRIDLTIVAPLADGLYRSRHRVIDIGSTAADSRFYELFDVLVFNIGNNDEHHRQIFDVLRNYPGVVICHDYVYQHFLAKIVHGGTSGFADYVALFARYATPEALRQIRRSNLTAAAGLHYAVWDSDLSAVAPLGAPLFQLGSALVVHSRYAEAYAAPRFDGPVLRLGMPHDQRVPSMQPPQPAGAGPRRTLVSFGHVQSTKCIDDVLLALAKEPRLRDAISYVISGFSGDSAYLNRLRGLIREHALDRCVRFALDLTDPELEALSAEADAFINLRYPNTEGASVSLIEQLITGKPVMVFDTGCYAEIPDDAVIKVARPRDVDAIAVAMHRLLDGRGELKEIGARGRAHAMQIDCRGYALDLLDFVEREEPMLRRRAAAHARCLIDIEAADGIEDEADDAWAEALATARTTFDLLDGSRLARDPELIGSLGPDRIVDYVQAAILRCGTNRRLTLALNAYFADARDTYQRCRILQVVRDAMPAAGPEALLRLSAVVPHGDLAFWEVVAALGPQAMSRVAHQAFFGRMPDETSEATYFGDPTDGWLDRLRLADALEKTDRRALKAPLSDLTALVAWLRAGEACEPNMALDPLPVGRSIDVGSAEQKRFVRMIGFAESDTAFAWTGPELGLIYVSPAPGATRIILSGHTLDDVVAVTITAATKGGIREAAQVSFDDRETFELALHDLPDTASAMPLCLTIRSSGCRSPADLNGSGDPRPLGFCLTQVTIQ